MEFEIFEFILSILSIYVNYSVNTFRDFIFLKTFTNISV
jgi:hypothetical protein